MITNTSCSDNNEINVSLCVLFIYVAIIHIWNIHMILLYLI